MNPARQKSSAALSHVIAWELAKRPLETVCLSRLGSSQSTGSDESNGFDLD